LPAPTDVQFSGADVERVYGAVSDVAAAIRRLPGVSDVFIPQDIDYPSLRLDIDRERASQLGLNQREVVDNVITALTSNQMIAPSYWGRSEERQRLSADGAISGEPRAQPARSAQHPAARRSHQGSDAAGRGHQGDADLLADGNRSLPDPPGHRHLRQPGWRGSRPPRHRHPPGAGDACAAGWRARGRARHGPGHG